MRSVALGVLAFLGCTSSPDSERVRLETLDSASWRVDVPPGFYPLPEGRFSVGPDRSFLERQLEALVSALETHSSSDTDGSSRSETVVFGTAGTDATFLSLSSRARPGECERRRASRSIPEWRIETSTVAGRGWFHFWSEDEAEIETLFWVHCRDDYAWEIMITGPKAKVSKMRDLGAHLVRDSTLTRGLD
jgi:hypothetical protein